MLFNAVGDDESLVSADLKKSWTKFTFPSVDAVRIQFVNDIGTTNDIFLRNPEMYLIDFKETPSKWKCGTKKANERCSWVKGGRFHWKGNYVIRQKGIPCSHF